MKWNAFHKYKRYYTTLIYILTIIFSSCSNQINQIYKHCLKVWTLHHTFFNHLVSASNTSRSHTDIDKHHFITQLIQMFNVRAFLQLSWPPFTNRGSLQWEQENHSSLHAAPVIPVRLLIPVVHQSDPVCLKSDFSGYLCDQAAADLSLTYQLDKCFSLYPLLFQTGFAARTTAEVFN